MNDSESDETMNFQWSSRKKNVTEKDVFEDVTWKFEDLVNKLEVRHREDGPDIPKGSFVTQNMPDQMIETQYHPRFGKCHTYSVSNQWREWGVGSISIWM